ncbi:thioredoxin family protein [Microbacterium sp. LRZ72]|uniref:TlpA family protein disulfide reductase n=1 Tax=Microbacterium sp. LRZ72 TaxID=2942481 RepID=UPI0029A02BCB|nr:thioredoxin family protein [Microbacterium sp. LRZ72]MDX2377439.1 thioredoxin family protein [Microbacterium sp. LRZ72]
MSLVDATLVVVALVAFAAALGALYRWRQGRARHEVPHETVDAARLGADVRFGEHATLLQFSTDLCAKCPGVHRMLDSFAEARPGVAHVDVDVTHRADLAAHFHVLQTPTTLILDRSGVVRTRIGGVPRRDVIELELARVTASKEPLHV